MVKIVSEDAIDDINLLRNTSFSTMKKSLFEMMFKTINTSEIEQFFEMPEIESNVKGPAIMVIPIAIYS